jgi:predicted PurR-regulated permease PerM
MDSRRKFKWIASATIICVALAVLYITKAFIITILWSLFVAYLLYPLYVYLLRITKNKQVSALLTLSLVFVIFLICFLVVLDALITEVGLLESHYTIQDTANNFLIYVSGFAERYVPDASQYAEEASRQFEDFAKDAVPKLLSLASGVLTGIASELVLKFLDELKPIYQSLFNVYLITCVLTGVIAAIGFFLLGVSYPLLWGIVVAVFALLPLVGANLVYALMAIYYLAIQDYKMGLAILVFGIIFLTVIPENIIRPRLAMRSASIHPAITLLSFAAPLFVLGAVGIVVGPALYGFLLAVYRTNIRLMAEEEASADASDGGELVR